MPELPEVETIRRGIETYVTGYSFQKIVLRQRQLRYPVTKGIEQKAASATIKQLTRRGKYLLFYTNRGNLILHFGMSGSLRVLPKYVPASAYDHIDFVLNNAKVLRFRDPRRFGTVLWTQRDPLQHKLLRSLGVEPLTQQFDGDYLYRKSRSRNAIAIKNFIMDSKVVVGIGNIYANESLYAAGIHPARSVRRISRRRLNVLAASVRRVLQHAIKRGGTTLRDFIREDGNPGYFKVALKVYGRTSAPCFTCGRLIRCRTIGQRSSFFCGHCQR